MKKRVIVISLGGSLIIPERVNFLLLKKFKEVVLKNKRKYKFVVVCGGGRTARNYIEGLRAEKCGTHLESLVGIATTRLNARFMTYFFGNDCSWGIPHDMKEVKSLLRINDVVFCGALRYEKNETSDGTSAKLARFFNTCFINLTNVSGLYDSDPHENKNAKFIPQISSDEFYKMATKIKFKPGQHFILDQTAAYTIKKYNITTYLLGPDMKQLDNLLNDHHFVGSVICK